MAITRRTTLAAIAASPLTLAPASAQASDCPQGDPTLKKLYRDWSNERWRAEDRVSSAVKSGLVVDEDAIFERADALEAAIMEAPCRHSADLAVKVLVAVDTSEPDIKEHPYCHLGMIYRDALTLVGVSNIS